MDRFDSDKGLLCHTKTVKTSKHVSADGVPLDVRKYLTISAVSVKIVVVRKT